VGLLVGTDGYVAEGSIESVFMVEEGVLITPPLGRILSSVTRRSLLEAASLIGIPTAQEQILPETLYAADEIFTSHTGIKIGPINRFEDRTLDAPGLITRKLIDLMDNITSFKDDRFKGWFQPLT